MSNIKILSLQNLFKLCSFVAVFLLSAIMLLNAPASSAHQFSTAHAKLEPSGQKQYKGYLALSLQDIQQAQSIDPNNDGKLLWQEVKQSLPVIQLYLNERFTISQKTSDSVISCQLNWSNSPRLSELYGETLLHIPLTVSCPLSSISAEELVVQYNAFFEHLNDHKLLLSWNFNDGENKESGESYFIIDDSNQTATLAFVKTSLLDTINFYLYQGVIHIWFGLDHVLFVLALILPFAWLRFRQGRFSGTKKLAIKDLLVLITSFTLAHSITLTLTALKILSIPSQWAEIGIAISVAFTAINIITHWVKRLGVITFLFGLLHGMGFAGALSELGLSETYRISSIVAFNLGVEIGQVAIIFLLYPLLTRLRKTQVLQYRLVPTLAVLIALMGGYWILERL
ncbi:HupE/UreJ family protein [Kangiella sp.]|uniref:HupE/UreJ family protein n=1 Tax=Kangiella sp. TaxID=1920245 RepID=UPI003A92F0F7